MRQAKWQQRSAHSAGRGAACGAAHYQFIACSLLHGRPTVLVGHGRSSKYGRLSLQPLQVDIVFVEYAVNDRYRPTADWDREDRRAYERLLRKLLNLPQKPAVVMVQMYPAVANDNL